MPGLTHLKETLVYLLVATEQLKFYKWKDELEDSNPGPNDQQPDALPLETCSCCSKTSPYFEKLDGCWIFC